MTPKRAAMTAAALLIAAAAFLSHRHAATVLRIWDYETGEIYVEVPARAGDRLFFGPEEGRVTHVAVKFGKDTVIHASGRVRIDRIDEQGIFNAEEQRYTHRLLSIRRVM